MPSQAILNHPLHSVLKPEIALPMQQVLGLYTIGQFLAAWGQPGAQDHIVAMFDSPAQARHAIAVCAGWLGGRFAPVMPAAPGEIERLDPANWWSETTAA